MWIRRKRGRHKRGTSKNPDFIVFTISLGGSREASDRITTVKVKV